MNKQWYYASFELYYKIVFREHLQILVSRRLEEGRIISRERHLGSTYKHAVEVLLNQFNYSKHQLGSIEYQPSTVVPPLHLIADRILQQYGRHLKSDAIDPFQDRIVHR